MDDPQQAMRLTTSETLSAVPEQRLQADWLRQHFAQSLSRQTDITIESPLLSTRTSPPIPAAVLIPLVVYRVAQGHATRHDDIHVLFTQRSQQLQDHAGQISFPGGRVAASDVTVQHTALRETQEEIGLASQHIEVIGALPEYLTATGYRVTPVVGLLTPPFTLKPDPIEVSRVFEVPLHFLMNPQHHQRRQYIQQNRPREFYAIPYHDPHSQNHHFIWGATAGMLRNLAHFLLS